MTDLSPAAQAVDNATCYDMPNRVLAAAAIRALADQVVPEPSDIDKRLLSLAAIRKNCRVRDAILTIANELEGK